MNADAVLTVVVALCCVAAIGTTSTTLDSTVSTNPDDVVDVEREDVPVGVEQAEQLHEAINGDEESTDESSGAGEPSDSGDPQRASNPAENGDPTPSQADSNEKAQNQASSDGGQEQNQQQKRNQNQNAASKSIEPPPEPNLLDRLLSLLRALLDAILAVLPYALLLAVAVAAVVRFRHRLRPYANRLLPGSAGDDAGPAPTPQNDVAAAWFEMVERLDIADRRNLTPRECTEVARQRGVDADAAATLTALFEEVRYGGARVTDERRERARRSIRRIRSQLEVRG